MPGNYSLVDLSRFSILALVFLAVTLEIVTVAPMVLTRIAVRRRLPAITGTHGGLTSAGSLRGAETQNFWTRLVQQIESRGLSLADTDAQSARAKQIGRDTSELQSLMPISYAVFCLQKTGTQTIMYSDYRHTNYTEHPYTL